MKMRDVFSAWFLVLRAWFLVVRSWFKLAQCAQYAVKTGLTPNVYRLTSLLVFSLLSSVFSPAVHAQITRTWQFDNNTHYEVSDPLLIHANTAGGGRAELILQETFLDQSDLLRYIQNSIVSGVRLGSEQVLELSKDAGGKYVAPGVYRSRVLDKGQDTARWLALFSKSSNVQLMNSPATIDISSQGLINLFRFDNNLTDAFSGQDAATTGIPVTYTIDARAGSAAANFAWNNGSITAESKLDNSSAISVTFWAYPFANQLGFATFFTHGVYTGIEGFITFYYYNNVTRNTAVVIRVGPDDSWREYRIDTPLPVDHWTMVTVAWNGVTHTLDVYFNRDLVLRTSHVSGGLFSGNSLVIGERTEFSGRRINSIIDEFAVWNRSLTEDDVFEMYDRYRALLFRLRSSSTPQLSGDFTGPSGTTDSFYLGVADQLTAAGNFNPIHRYLQYEARLFTDGPRENTPQIQYVKFLRADGEVFTDSTAGDFMRAESLQNLTNAPYQSYTPYFGLSRAPNGGFRTSGTYLSRPIDGGPNAVWERLRWRLPLEIANTDPGLVALYHLDGNWVDVVPAGGANNPSAQNNTAFSSAARLGFNAAQFSENTGGSTVSNFFSAAQNITSLSFWIKPENMSDGILEVGGGSVSIRDHQIVTAGYGANSPQIFVNANPQASYLQPGWNHVVLVWPSAINAQQLLVGRANGDYFNGLLDELALYTTTLTMGQVQVQYYNAHPISSGVASFRARAAATSTFTNATWVGPFSDPATASFSIPGRYVQYEIVFSGDGSGTPAVGNVRVEGQDGVATFSVPTLTLSEAAAGNFGGDAVAWYGDEI